MRSVALIRLECLLLVMMDDGWLVAHSDRVEPILTYLCVHSIQSPNSDYYLSNINEHTIRVTDDYVHTYRVLFNESNRLLILLFMTCQDPTKKTVLIYGHLDVMPANKEDGKAT